MQARGLFSADSSGTVVQRLVDHLQISLEQGWWPWIAALLVIVSFASRLVRRWSRERKRLRQIRLHQCAPTKNLSRNPWYFGLDIAYETITSYSSGSRNKRLLETFGAVGPTFRSVSADTGRIFTNDPRNLKAVFGGSSEDWGVAPVRLEAFRPLFGEGVLNTDGAVWKHSRLLAQSVIERVYRVYCTDLSFLDPHLEKMLGLLPRDGSTVDLQPIFYQLTTDISTQHVFGESIGAMNPGPEGDHGKRFLDAFLHCLTMVGERDEAPSWTHSLWDRKFSRACRIVHSHTEANIHQAVRLNMAGDNGDENSRGKGTSEWERLINDKERARDQIINVMAASFDTSAIFLTNIFFHLARNPRCYQKLRQEVLAFDGVPDSNNIKTLTYLHQVLNETLRLHGPASFDSRVALRDAIIPAGGGDDGNSPVFVPKGEIVIVSFFALQRDPSVYGEDAEVFRPERWETLKPKHWNFMPFSGGARVCPGQKVALLQAAYILFRFVQRFGSVINRDPVSDFVEEYRVATGSKNGALVSIEVS